MDDPMLMGMMMQAFEKEQAEKKEEDKKGPFHSSWYKDNKKTIYPEPSLSDVTLKATNDRNEWQGLLDRYQEDTDLLSDESNVTGVFQGFDSKIEEAWYSSAIVSEKNLIKAKIGGIEPIFTSKNQNRELSEEIDEIENFMYAIDAEADRQYTNATGGSRKLAVADDSLSYGHICQRNLPNWDGDDDCQVPFIMTLIDPATVFPTFEGHRGLGTVTRWYSQTVREMIADYPKHAKTIREGLLKDADQKSGIVLQLDDEVECIEYWDRRWFCLVASGKWMVEPVEHDLGEPPFVWKIVDRGDSSHTTSPQNTRRNAQSGSTNASRRDDHKHRGLSIIGYRRRTHAQREAILGSFMTQVRWNQNKSLWVYQDDFALEKGLPEITSAPGGRSQLWKNHEDIKEPSMGPSPSEFGPLLQASDQDLSREGMPPSSYGINQNSNVSGYAVSELNASGLDKLTYDIIAVADFYQQCVEQCLRIFNNWGHLLGKTGRRGEVTIGRPYRDLRKRGDITIKPYDVRCVGSRVDCRMTTTSIENIAPKVNTANMLKQAGFATDAQLIRWLDLPWSREAEETVRQVKLDQVKDQPEYKLAKLAKYVYEVEDDAVLAEFILKQLAAGRAKEQAQNPGGAPPGGPPPLGGQSMPMLGKGPGPGSGPQGPTGGPNPGPPSYS